MKIVFIGATTFGFECLLTIRQNEAIEVVGIISNEQRFSISYNKEGVNNILHKDFENYAERNNILFYRMKENMKESKLGNFLSKCNPELIVVIGWYHLIPANLLRQYTFTGIHNSLLPAYSGGAPLVWAIIMGENKTGVTFFYFDEGIDSGDIIAQEEIEINDEDTIKTLYKKAEQAARNILIKYLPLLATNSAPRIKQDENKRQIFPQRKQEDGKIDWNWNSKKIKDFIRAQTKPYPGAFTIINNKKVIIWDADIEED
ncbi:MAG: methionyl-tRNA formyltransferase [Bacteroidota bacterium]|nr:methionyl-tRNA formyltransferase [Bacteroidota bacterium]